MRTHFFWTCFHFFSGKKPNQKQYTSTISLINFSTWLLWISQTKASFFSCDKSFSLTIALHHCGDETKHITSFEMGKTIESYRCSHQFGMIKAPCIFVFPCKFLGINLKQWESALTQLCRLCTQLYKE